MFEISFIYYYNADLNYVPIIIDNSIFIEIPNKFILGYHNFDNLNNMTLNYIYINFM